MTVWVWVLVCSGSLCVSSIATIFFIAAAMSNKNINEEL